MNKALASALALAFAATLAACGRSEPERPATPARDDSALTAVINIAGLALSGDQVRIRASAAPEARIEAGGRLFVDGQEIPINDAQRAELVAYHAAAMQLRENAKQTGIAGAKVGIAAAGAVLEGLATGDPDSIGPRVEAEAQKVQETALRMCDDLAALKSAQDALAADLEAFRPYATIDEDDVSGCRRDADAGEAPASPDSPAAPPAQEVTPAGEEPQFI